MTATLTALSPAETRRRVTETFAGVTGFCGMARLLMLAPWNRRAGAA